MNILLYTLMLFFMGWVLVFKVIRLNASLFGVVSNVLMMNIAALLWVIIGSVLKFPIYTFNGTLSSYDFVEPGLILCVILTPVSVISLAYFKWKKGDEFTIRKKK